MLCMMTIKVNRKDLNEKNDYTFDVTNDDSTSSIGADDESVIELLSEIIRSNNAHE